MSIQILEVAVFDHKGERQVMFPPARANKSANGSAVDKAVLTDIVDYCVTGNDCPQFAGLNGNAVGWYVVRLQVDLQRIVIGRPALLDGQKTCSEVFLQAGDEKGLPDYSEMKPNADTTALSGLMTQAMGTSAAVSWAVGYNLRNFHVALADVKKIEAGEGLGTGVLIRIEHRLFRGYCGSFASVSAARSHIIRSS